MEGSLPFTVHCIQEKGITIQQEHRHLNLEEEKFHQNFVVLGPKFENLAPISCPMQEGESFRVNQTEKLNLFCKLSTNLKGEWSLVNIHNG